MKKIMCLCGVFFLFLMKVNIYAYSDEVHINSVEISHVGAKIVFSVNDENMINKKCTLIAECEDEILLKEEYILKNKNEEVEKKFNRIVKEYENVDFYILLANGDRTDVYSTFVTPCRRLYDYEYSFGPEGCCGYYKCLEGVGGCIELAVGTDKYNIDIDNNGFFKFKYNKKYSDDVKVKGNVSCIAGCAVDNIIDNIKTTPANVYDSYFSHYYYCNYDKNMYVYPHYVLMKSGMKNDYMHKEDNLYFEYNSKIINASSKYENTKNGGIVSSIQYKAGEKINWWIENSITGQKTDKFSTEVLNYDLKCNGITNEKNDSPKILDKKVKIKFDCIAAGKYYFNSEFCVYVKVGEKTIEKITNNGNYGIVDIPELKVGDKISAWVIDKFGYKSNIITYRLLKRT